jgi:hypothetical protein
LEAIGREGDGWVNWSGLATLLANIEKAFAEEVNRMTFSWEAEGARPRGQALKA